MPDPPPSGQPPEPSRAPDAGTPDGAAGVDLARAALAAARATARARGEHPGRPGAVAGRRGWRRAASPNLRSGSRPDDRDPQPFAASIDRLVAERGWEVPAAVGGVVGRWPQIVGPDIAAHCVPETVVEGQLTVRADSTAWATQVRLLAPVLLRRLADELGPGIVRRVRVVGPAGPNWRRGPRGVRGRGPRDTYG